MNIIVRVITGVIQDRDNNSYDNVTIVYVVLAGCSVVVSLLLAVASWNWVDLGQLQWPRKLRIARGEVINERRRKYFGEDGPRSRLISRVCFGATTLLVLGSWSAYFWGVATGNNG